MGYELRERCKINTGLVMQSDPIRKAIIEHPDLPLVFLANEDANNGDYTTMFCTQADFWIGEILDCWQDIEENRTFTDREEFRDAIDENIYRLTGYDDRSEEWYKSEIKRIEKLYEPYWRPCILITVGN